MTVKPIRVLGDPVLHQPADWVETRSDGALPEYVDGVIADMYDTLTASGGVALAAPQIGFGLRIFVYDCPEERGQSPRRRGAVVNPVLEKSEISQLSPHPENDREGCLSAPGVMFPIARADWARVTGVNSDGKKVDVRARGLIARMFQHEIAHLDGVMYLDQLVTPYAEQARRFVRSRGWGIPGLSWTPGVGPHPFECHRGPSST
jgi:peptide deformylase